MQGNNKDSDVRTVSELYSELSQEQPSTTLDEKILAAAHKAVEPKRAPGPFSGTWMVPASMAAVIVLSVIVVTLIEKKEPDAITSFPEPETIQEEITLKRQALGSPATEPVIDSDSGESRSIEMDEIRSEQAKPPAPTMEKREKKKARIALAKPASSSKIIAESKVIAEQEASLQAMSKDSEVSRLSGIAPTEDVEIARSLPRKMAAEPADDSASMKELADGGMQSQQLAQKAQSSKPQQAAATAPVFAQPRAFVAEPLKDDSVQNCSNLTELGCLKSSACILQLEENGNSYQCRAADNNCESGFVQLLHQKPDCEAKLGCKYLPADCYCAPNENCQCRGGMPAMCVPAQEDTSR